MKQLVKIACISFLFVNTFANAAAEKVPEERKITKLSVYDDTVVGTFEPGYTNSQGCSRNSTTRFRFDIASDGDRQLLSTLLTAAAANKNVGFGIDGCVGGYPQVYRVDVVF